MKKIYIVGAGGFGREVLWLVQRINEREIVWDIQGFIDDDETLTGKEINGYKVIGTTSFLKSMDEDVYVVIAIGSPKIKKIILEKLKGNNHLHYPKLIDPSVVLSEHVKIGEGSIICAGSILTVNIEIGKHVIINIDCKIGHDVVVEDYASMMGACSINGEVTIGNGAYLGCNVITAQQITIGENAFCAMGSVIVRNVEPSTKVIGNPAREYKCIKDVFRQVRAN